MDVFQTTAIALVSINHINGLHLFWDTLIYIKYPNVIKKIIWKQFSLTGQKQVLTIQDFRGPACDGNEGYSVLRGAPELRPNHQM